MAQPAPTTKDISMPGFLKDSVRIVTSESDLGWDLQWRRWGIKNYEKTDIIGLTV